MGVAIFPIIEDGSGGWTDQINGKCLSRAVDVLDKAAKREKVAKLFDFYSHSREESIIEHLGGDPDDPTTFNEADILPTIWHSVEAGLSTVRALLRFVRDDGAGINDLQCVREDLEEFERVLVTAEHNGKRWYLGMSA
jgi:hypothetical protein